jgi:hypothetical protein
MGMGGQQPGGFGQPGGGMPPNMGAAGAAALATVSNPMAALVPGAKPKVRNPIMTLVLPIGLMVVGSILSSILGMIAGILALVGTLVVLAGWILGLIYAISMVRELHNYTQDPEFMWWWVFIPIYGALIKVPEQVTKAKAKAGILQVKPVRGIVLYLFLWLYALAGDLNDIAES